MERPKTDSKSSHIGRVPLAPRDFGPQAGDRLMRMLLEDALTFPPKPWHLSDGENDGKRMLNMEFLGISMGLMSSKAISGGRWRLDRSWLIAATSSALPPSLWEPSPGRKSAFSFIFHHF